MILQKIKALPIILGSQSPRRSELLKSLDLDFSVLVKSIDESIPNEIFPTQAAEYIALEKLKAFRSDQYKEHLVITADTVVVDSIGRTLGKPTDSLDAQQTIASLSNTVHHVYTGVGLQLREQVWSFTCCTEVEFYSLSKEEIGYYVEKYKPYDKAGSYGIQEWIGRIGVKRINGSYENVMGLPTNRLYKELYKIEKGL